MNLHRTNKVADWSAIPKHKRNIWQRIAVRTYGVGTPGNALSVAGFCLVVLGLWTVVTHSLWEGTVLISSGRLGDILDGIIAHYTGTKSPLGRAVDALLDKVGALAALVIFALHGIMPGWVASAIILQNVANIMVSVYAPWRHIFLNPSQAGKLSTAGFWVTIVAFVASKLLETSHLAAWEPPVAVIAYVLAAASLGLGCIATGGYVLAVLRMPPHNVAKLDE